MRKRPNYNTNAGLREAASGKIPEKPDHIALRPQDAVHWFEILETRPASSWNDSDLTLAGQLARCRADIETVQASIDEEGLFSDPQKQAFLEKLTRRGIALARLLGANSAKSIGALDEISKRTGLSRSVMRKLEELHEKDDLFARPFWLDDPVEP